jgi:putative ABC transport system substrate-binding protein
MRRREFITLLGGAAATWPLAARAQQPRLPVIGFLATGSASDPSGPGQTEAAAVSFRQGLGETGYVEGRNVAIEYRFAEGHKDRVPALAADLLRRQVAVIYADGPAVAAAKAATTTIPIVFTIGGDPVADGLVASLSRPGGNLTGVTTLGTELGPKRLEIMHELAPGATVIAALLNPNNSSAETQAQDTEAAARVLGLQVRILHASAERDFDPAFASVARLGAEVLYIAADGFFNAQSKRLGALAVRYAVPAIHQTREFAAAGGLASYGGDFEEQGRLVGVYIGRILKGEKPADLPVQQATKVELIINLKTAKALGITVPLPLLGLADQVIE